MKGIPILIMVALSLLALSSIDMITAYGASSKGAITMLVLKSVPLSVYYGEEIRLTGELVDARTGEGIAGAEVKVIDNRPVDQEVLATAKTRKYGLFVAKFNATLDDPSREGLLYLLAKFEGSEVHAPSVSRESSVMVKLLPLELRFQYLKSEYSQGESPEIIFTVTSEGEPIEPETIRANFDGRPVSVTSYGKGNYLYVTPPLSKGWHQFFVNVSKPGCDTVSQMISINVV